MKGTSGDAGGSEENIELLEKKLEEFTKEIETNQNRPLIKEDIFMYECGYCNAIGSKPIDSWINKITSAQMENIRKNFSSAKPMNEESLRIVGVSANPSDSASAVKPTRSGSITVINHNVMPYHTGYARIDNMITDALKGKSQELKDNVYDIIRNDLLRHNVHGLEESDRMALISLGVEKAEYLADNFMDDKSKNSFMEAIRSIAKIGTEGKRVGTCTMEYNVKHVIGIDGDGYVHDSNSEKWLFAMEKSDPEAFETYNKLMKASGDGKIEAAFFEIRWAMKNLDKVEAYRTVYERQQDEKYSQLQKVKLDQTFSGSDTSGKDNFLASIAEKLKAAKNLNVNFFLEQISRMTQTSGGYLLGRVMSLSARA